MYPPLPSLPSLCSLLWKLLLAHPWIHLAALSPHPLSQCISRSHGGAAVFRYVSGESMSERGRGQAYRPHANQSGGFSFNTANLVYRQRQSPAQGRGTHCNIVIRCKIHASHDVGLSLVYAWLQKISFLVSFLIWIHLTGNLARTLVKNHTRVYFWHMLYVCTNRIHSFPSLFWLRSLHEWLFVMVFNPLNLRTRWCWKHVEDG